MRGARGTAARRPGIDRQPSQRSTRSSLSSSISGLITTVLPTGVSLGVLVAARLGHPEHEQPQRHVHLRRGQAGAGRVLHRLHHVGDQAADFRCAGIRHRFTHLQQHRVAHAGYLQNGHVLRSLSTG